MLISTCILKNVYSLYILRTTRAGYKVPGTLFSLHLWSLLLHCLNGDLRPSWSFPSLYMTWFLCLGTHIILYLFKSRWFFFCLNLSWFTQFSLSEISVNHRQDFFPYLYSFFHFLFPPVCFLCALSILHFVRLSFSVFKSSFLQALPCLLSTSYLSISLNLYSCILKKQIILSFLNL